MKMIRSVPLLALLMVFGACQDAQREQPVPDHREADTQRSDPDEAIQEWEDAWNSNNARRVQQMTADDAVLLMNGTMSHGDSIAPWIERSATGMRDLRLESRMRNSSGGVAYDAGTFSHGLHGNNTVEYRGAYTFIWERTNDDDWQVKVMNIADMPEEEMEAQMQNQNQ